MNITPSQIFAIALVVLGVFVASTAQMTDLFGAVVARNVASLSGLLMSLVAGVQGVLFGGAPTQESQLRAVRAMPGVEKVLVNSQANPMLATMAVDPTEPKIEPIPGAINAVNRTAASQGS